VQIVFLPCLEETCKLPGFATVEIREFSEGDGQVADMASEGRAPATSWAV
jgi:hypothetical protein